MEEIIKNIMETCALNHAKGYPRWMHLWDEQKTIQQKAIDISNELEAQGYIIIKSEDLRPLCDENGE